MIINKLKQNWLVLVVIVILIISIAMTMSINNQWANIDMDLRVFPSMQLKLSLILCLSILKINSFYSLGSHTVVGFTIVSVWII